MNSLDYLIFPNDTVGRPLMSVYEYSGTLTLLANEISPGLGSEPPPTNATADALWCGLRKGRYCGLTNVGLFNNDAKMALSNISSGVKGGKIDGKRCANIDLPVPGGPIINRLCPPAAANSKA